MEPNKVFLFAWDTLVKGEKYSAALDSSPENVDAHFISEGINLKSNLT